MAPILPPDLNAPFEACKLIQLRTSKMQTMRDLKIQTGIYKQPRTSRVFCSSTGLESDEHDLTFHGGVDKAVHQYYSGHYLSWKDDFPHSRDAFVVGGFGENLVADGNMNERNICIGDKIQIGGKDGVLLQVSLPRQPCFKLNHRFGIEKFQNQTWKKSRTGWYYRVLKEGWMGVGDSIELVERRHEKWTIERIQEYIHRDKSNLQMLEELSQIEEFGKECKEKMSGMIAGLIKQREGRGKKEKEVWAEFELVEKKRETKRITSFVLQAVGTTDEGEEMDSGSFVRLRLPNGLIRSYSIVSGKTHRFQLGIALDDNSRGGSRYLHKSFNLGFKILVGKITESVPISSSSSNHIFIVGGIGITAFLAHTDVFDQINFNYELHYAVRSKEDIPFKELLENMGEKLVVYDRAKGQQMDIPTILKTRKWNSFIYTCGPQHMIAEVIRASKATGMSQDEIHYEAFQTDTSGDLFTVEVKKENEVLEVKEDQTLLQVLREAGLEIDSSCETGNCGTCRVEVCEGKVEHRGSALSEEDKGKAMLSCVSRGVGHLVIDF